MTNIIAKLRLADKLKMHCIWFIYLYISIMTCKECSTFIINELFTNTNLSR